MKYIDNINWEKVSEKMIAVTNTNLGTRDNPKLECHLLDPKTQLIESLGIFDKERILTECNVKGINIGELVGWESSNEDVIDGFMAQKFMNVAKWFIGRILNTTSVKISKLI